MKTAINVLIVALSVAAGLVTMVAFLNRNLTRRKAWIVLSLAVAVGMTVGLVALNPEWFERNYLILLGGGGVLAVVGSMVALLGSEIKEARRGGPLPRGGQEQRQGLTAGGSVMFLDTSGVRPGGAATAGGLVMPTTEDVERYSASAKPRIRLATDDEIARYDPRLRQLVRVIREHVRRGDLALLALVYEALGIPLQVWEEAIPQMDHEELSDLSRWVTFLKENLASIAGSLQDAYDLPDSNALADALCSHLDGIQDGIVSCMDGGGLG